MAWPLRAWAAASGSVQALWAATWFKCAVGAAGAVLASLAMSGGSIDTAAVAAVIRDPGSVLDQRSPGARAPGALTLTKRGRTAAADVFPTTPHQRVLSAARMPLAAGMIPAVLPGTAFAEYGPQPAGGPVAAESAFEPTPAGGNIGPYPFVSPVIGGGIGAPGNGGGGGGATVVTPPVVTPVSSVPEPSSWTTMILGVGAIAMMLRRRLAIDRAGMAFAASA